MKNVYNQEKKHGSLRMHWNLEMTTLLKLFSDAKEAKQKRKFCKKILIELFIQTRDVNSGENEMDETSDVIMWKIHKMWNC